MPRGRSQKSLSDPLCPSIRIPPSQRSNFLPPIQHCRNVKGSTSLHISCRAVYPGQAPKYQNNVTGKALKTAETVDIPPSLAGVVPGLRGWRRAGPLLFSCSDSLRPDPTWSIHRHVRAFAHGLIGVVSTEPFCRSLHNYVFICVMTLG